MAGGQNTAGTDLPAWLLEANATTHAAALEAQCQRRPECQVHYWVRGGSRNRPGPGLAP